MAARSSSRSTVLACAVVAIASTLTFTVAALAGTVRVDGESSPRTAVATTIAKLHGFTPVRAWNGIQAWTDYSTADKRWHVVVRRDGALSIPPAIPAGDERLKVDVGPGPFGNPSLAFVSCAEVCRVVVSDLDGNRKRTVPGSERASSPTIWSTRVAWVRGEGRNARYLAPTTVLTSRLGVSGMTRLPGAPRRKCYRAFSGHRRCERPGGTVDDLELQGSQLALIDSYSLSQGGGGNGTTEVRLEPVPGGPQRLIAAMNVGEGQQTWIGPSWANGSLYFYRSCPFSCPKAQGAYRYTPESGAYAMAAGKYPISGFAMDGRGRRAFEALGLFGDRADSGGELTTSLRLTDELKFTSTRAPIADPGAF